MQMLGARAQPAGAKQALNIVDRPLPKAKNEIPTVSLSAFAYLFSELIQYAMDRASSTGELEDRLDRVGFDIGARLIELLSWRERALKRKPEILDILRWVHSVAWPAVFGKNADDLQQAREADDEYMITDNDLLISRYISVPRSYGSFNPGALVAGVVRGILDTAGFPALVSAHWNDRATKQPGSSSRLPVIILIKFDPAVMQRQAHIEALKRG